MGQARPCMKMPNRTSAIATLRFRQRRPAVIIESQSRHERRSSCAANQVRVPGAVIGALLAPNASCPAKARALQNYRGVIPFARRFSEGERDVGAAHRAVELC